MTQIDTSSSIDDMKKSVPISKVLKLIKYHQENDIIDFKATALEIADNLNSNGFTELANYIWALYGMVRTFEITD